MVNGGGDVRVVYGVMIWYLEEPDVVVDFFFFQAEDGIRDLYVTGVQTCALPISGTRRAGRRSPGSAAGRRPASPPGPRVRPVRAGAGLPRRSSRRAARGHRRGTPRASWPPPRSEERRVGKECRSRGGRVH